MFSCKHELAALVTHPRILTGEATTMTNLYTCLRASRGHISANEGAPPVKFRLQLADACPTPLMQKNCDGNANSTKTAYYTTHKKVLQYMVGFLRLGHIIIISNTSSRL